MKKLLFVLTFGLSIFNQIQSSESEMREKCSETIHPISYRPTEFNSLVYFASSDNYGRVGKLIADNVDVNLPDGNGVTPLMTAALIGGNLSILSLLTPKAKVNTADNSGRTALMYAASGGTLGTPGVLQKLIVRGAGVNETDTLGRTAFMYAVASVSQSETNYREKMKILLLNGAEIKTVDHEGHTAASIYDNLAPQYMQSEDTDALSTELQATFELLLKLSLVHEALINTHPLASLSSTMDIDPLSPSQKETTPFGTLLRSICGDILTEQSEKIEDNDARVILRLMQAIEYK